MNKVLCFLGLTLLSLPKLMAFSLNPNGACFIEGRSYPPVGFGTYPLKEKVCQKAVEEAIGVGYRIFDTATFYDNFEAIGGALNTFGREKCYIISKVWPNSQTKEGIRKDIEDTLRRLNTTYLDAYLIHWPTKNIPIEETLTAMECLRKEGLVRHLGLSNVTIAHLKRAFELNIPIQWVQVEMNPFFFDRNLLNLCAEKGILVQAWAPLGRGKVIHDPLLRKIGKKYGKTPSQVAIRWIQQHGALPLPGSKEKTHIQENFLADFNLNSEEMEKIDRRAISGRRERVTEEFGLGFTDEFDLSYEEVWPRT